MVVQAAAQSSDHSLHRIGVAVGLLLGDNARFLEPFGDAIIRLLKMLIVPHLKGHMKTVKEGLQLYSSLTPDEYCSTRYRWCRVNN